jgi:hypothetical protein
MRSRRTRCSIVESGVVGVEAEMRRRFACGGKYVEAQVSARCLWEKDKWEKERYERKRGRKREKGQTVHRRWSLWPSRI